MTLAHEIGLGIDVIVGAATRAAAAVPWHRVRRLSRRMTQSNLSLTPLNTRVRPSSVMLLCMVTMVHGSLHSQRQHSPHHSPPQKRPGNPQPVYPVQTPQSRRLLPVPLPPPPTLLWSLFPLLLLFQMPIICLLQLIGAHGSNHRRRRCRHLPLSQAHSHDAARQCADQAGRNAGVRRHFGASR